MLHATFFECYAEGQPHFYATRLEVRQCVESLSEAMGQPVEAEDLFRAVAPEAIDMEHLGDTSDETRRAIAAARR